MIVKKKSAQASSKGAGVGVKPKTDSSGAPVQTDKQGTCKYPGCSYPRRIEASGHIHDFCSRTCADKFGKLPATSAMSSSSKYVCS